MCVTNKQTRFIKQPFITNLEDKGLKYTDLFTLYTLLSFRNNNTKLCNPSIRTLVRTTNCSDKFIQQSIERLVASKLVNVEKGNRDTSNRYRFNIEDERFKMLPYDLLSNEELTINEKAILIAIRQCCLDDKIDSIMMKSQIAKAIGISYSAFRKQFDNLKEKGYVEERTIYGKKVVPEGEYYEEKFQIRMNQDKINWQLKVLTARIDDAEEKLDSTVNEVAALNERIAFMELQVAKLLEAQTDR